MRSKHPLKKYVEKFILSYDAIKIETTFTNFTSFLFFYMKTNKIGLKK